MLDARELEPALTAKETLLRDSFVAEYLKDFDAYKACIRLGFLPTFANIWSKKLTDDGYVQRKISHILRKPAAGPEQDAEDRALVESTLRLIMQRGSDSARASAAHKMMILKGWDKANDSGEGNEDLADMFRRVAQQLPS